MPARMHLIATFIHQINASWLAAYVGKGSLGTNWRFWERIPAESALQCDLVVFSLLTTHAYVVRIFLAACAEVVRAVSASDSEFGHVFGCLSCHCLTRLVLRCIIWLRWIEREYFLTAWALHYIVRISHQHLRLLFPNILKPFMTQGLSQVVSLYHRVALAAATFGEVPWRQLG